MSITKKKERLPPNDKDHFSKKIAAWILKLQSRWATFMDRKVSKWTPFQKTMGLVAICAIMGAHSGLALYQAFRVSPARQAAFTIKPVHISTVSLPQDTMTNHHIRLRMKALSIAIDSMQQSDSGRLWIADLKRIRPGLWDSIQMAIEYYK